MYLLSQCFKRLCSFDEVWWYIVQMQATEKGRSRQVSQLLFLFGLITFLMKLSDFQIWSKVYNAVNLYSEIPQVLPFFKDLISFWIILHILLDELIIFNQDVHNHEKAEPEFAILGARQVFVICVNPSLLFINSWVLPLYNISFSFYLPFLTHSLCKWVYAEVQRNA